MSIKTSSPGAPRAGYAALAIAVCSMFWQASVMRADELRSALLFHASFDQTADADFARGDARIYTAASLKREKVTPGLPPQVQVKENGKFGGYLNFSEQTQKVSFYHGAKNVPTTTAGFSGTYSFWLRLDPEKDLPEGYIDPLQITDKKWNDASFFVDFAKESPRHFRLGVFSDFDFWNPDKTKWEEVPENERPLVTVREPIFSRQKWTHVAISFQRFNSKSKDSEVTLFVNGESQGTLDREQVMHWKPENVVIMVGVYYVGDIDDFAIFNRALKQAEIKSLMKMKGGIRSLGAGTK